MSEPDLVCLHKGGQTYQSRVGEVCPFCCAIRHRHSRLEFIEIKRIGKMTVLSTIVVPR